MKRLVVGLSVSVLALFGAVPAASADSASSSDVAYGKVAKVKKANNGSFTSQGVVKAPGGGFSAQRIDWD